MRTIKRVIAALMVAFVIVTTTYQVTSINSQAVGLVITIGGVAVSVADLIAAIIATGCCAYIGNAFLSGDITIEDLQSEVDRYLNTTEGSNALIDYIDNLPTYSTLGGNAPKPPRKPVNEHELKAVTATEIYWTAELGRLIEGFVDYISDPANDSAVYDAITAASSQEVYLTNPVLPKNFFIGYNSDLVTYDRSTILGACVEICQVSDPAGSDFTDYFLYYKWLDFSREFDDSINYQVGLFEYVEGYDNVFKFRISDFNYVHPYVGDDYIGEQRVLPSKQYNVVNSNGSHSYPYNFPGAYINTDYAVTYLSPLGDEFIVFQPDADTMYRIYESGNAVNAKTGEVVSPSAVSTADGSLTSVKPIVNMDYSAFMKSLTNAMAEAYPDEVPELTPEMINEIYNNTSNYYDQAVTNYYSNPSYLTENEYITNITNVYEQAIADNPAVDDPAIPVSPTLGSLNDYKAVGLSDVFPFCIPFDMYDLMTILAAEPRAVSFDYTFYMGEYLGEYTYTVDLSIFDPVAKVIRTMELLLYMYGLMLVTRSLIRG